MQKTISKEVIDETEQNMFKGLFIFSVKLLQLLISDLYAMEAIGRVGGSYFVKFFKHIKI